MLITEAELGFPFLIIKAYNSNHNGLHDPATKTVIPNRLMPWSELISLLRVAPGQAGAAGKERLPKGLICIPK